MKKPLQLLAITATSALILEASFASELNQFWTELAGTPAKPLEMTVEFVLAISTIIATLGGAMALHEEIEKRIYGLTKNVWPQTIAIFGLTFVTAAALLPAILFLPALG
jgi:hypothetical protein